MKHALAVMAILLPFLSACQPLTIKGKLINEQSEPVAGATIVLKRTGFTTVSDRAGAFTIQNTWITDTLIITAEGYERVEEPSNERGLVTVILERKAVALAEVTVSTGYQQLPQERATGSFAKVGGSLLSQRSAPDILSRLDGVTPGLLFDRRSGSGNKLQLRGLSSLRTGGTAPLVILDNFPYEGDLANINPAEVESVTVLKDAAAASIWGARAGNGVIVITSRKGGYSQPLKVILSSTVTAAAKPDLFALPGLTSAEAIEVESFLFDKGYYNADLTNTTTRPALTPVVELLAKRRAGTISASDAEAGLAALRSHDVRSDLSRWFYRTGQSFQSSAAVSGGSTSARYYFSAGWDRSLATLVGNSTGRLTLRTDNSFLLAKRLEFGVALSYTGSASATNSGGGWGAYKIGARSLPPYASLVGEGGEPLPIAFKYRGGFTDTAGAGRLLDWSYRPLAELRAADNGSAGKQLVLNFSLSYRLSRTLGIELRYAGEEGSTTARNYYSTETFFTRDLVNRFSQVSGSTVKYIVPLGGILDLSENSLHTHSGRAGLNWNATAGAHRWSAIGGAEIRQAAASSYAFRTYGYNEDLGTATAVDYTTRYPVYAGLSGTANIPASGGFGSTLTRMVSLYANGSYTYANRYTLSASARKDAANLFGVRANNRWSPLWSVGAAWSIDKEGFYRWKALPVLRLRLTWGYSGNMATDASAFTTITYRDAANSILNLPSASIRNAPNPDLGWERVGMGNAGLDFGVRGGRITGSLEYFRKRTAGLLGTQSLDPTTGIGSITSNSANLSGQGVDFVLNTVPVKGGFTWQNTVQASWVRTEVTAYLSNVPDVASSYIGSGSSVIPRVGLQPYSIVSYRWAGLDGATGDPLGWLNGAISKDYNAMRATTLSGLVVSGPALAPLFGSWRNTVSYRWLALTANITGRFGYWFRRPSLSYSTLFAQGVGSAEYRQRWQKAGDETFTNVPSMVYPAVSARDAFYASSEATVERGDHLRLEWINLSVTWERRESHKLPFGSGRLFLAADNLNLVLWKRNRAGLDPDYPGLLPPSKTVSLGFTTTF